MSVRVALVAGPMYDHLYAMFDDAGIDVEIVVHEDHPTLNRRVAEMLSAGDRLDLISTHAKYAPAQSQWLRPLDELVDPDTLAALAPRAVDLGRFDGRLWCVPRNIDVRILWTRSDRMDSAPDTWAALDHRETPFGFPGRESGLFGTFFELVVGAGGALFDGAGQPTMDTPDAVAAIDQLVRLCDRAPADLPAWHYDDVDRALLDGRVDAAGAWPGAWGAIARSPLADRLTPHPYPAGAVRRVSYSGCHAWAIPRAAADVDGALALLHLLAGANAQTLDARGGTICAHRNALATLEPVDDLDRARLEITRRTIADAMITYPPLPAFPAIEDAGWAAIHAALEHRITAGEAAARIQRVAEAVLAADPDRTPA